jgi:anti-sigma regulatory factor (Ser/Thr protein kinase)
MRLLDHGLRHLVDDLQLVVSELATNAMVHAKTPFLVTLCAFEESVRLEVLDGGQSGPVQYAAQTLETSGRGVAIVDDLARAWGVTGNTSGGKFVWAEFDRSE